MLKYTYLPETYFLVHSVMKEYMLNIPCVFLLCTYELLLHKCKLNILTYDVYRYLTNLLEKICVFLKKCRTASRRTRVLTYVHTMQLPDMNLFFHLQ